MPNFLSCSHDVTLHPSDSKRVESFPMDEGKLALQLLLCVLIHKLFCTKLWQRLTISMT